MPITANTTTSNTIPMRQRARHACKPCQQRKKKCDGTYPCASCIGYGYDCQYAQPGENGSSQKPSPTERSGSSQVDKDSPVNHSHSNGVKRPRLSPSPPAERDGSAPDSVLDPAKGRFVANGTAIACPWNLGVELNSANPPRLHSFAWNAGVRREQLIVGALLLPSMMRYDDAVRYMRVYLDVIHPIYGIVHEETFIARCKGLWEGSERMDAFEAIVCGAVALGSLFARTAESLTQEFEDELVKRAKDVLDGASTTRRPVQELVAAWILRTLYLRATTRPHIAWMASCTAMHIAESIGLHHELDASSLVMPTAKLSVLPEREKEIRRRIFLVAEAVNGIVSFEYGRRRVDLGECSCKPLTTSSSIFGGKGDCTARLVGLGKLVMKDEGNNTRVLELDAALAQFCVYAPGEEENPAILLLEADVGFGIYRRLRLRKREVGRECLTKVINLGRMSLRAASRVAAKGQPWWHVVAVPFQFVCILLAIDTLESLAVIKEAMEVLETVVGCFQTHLAEEALQTARMLVSAAGHKKMTELGLLEAGNGETIVKNGVANGTANGTANGVSNGIGEVVMGDVNALSTMPDMPLLPMGFFEDDSLFDWDEFLNPTNTAYS